MADRYLLESSSVDGYLLEDSSGVLLLDAPPALAPDGGEDSGAWGIFQSAVIGGVVAAGLALSSGNARAAANSYQDEVPYATGNGISYSQPYTSRAQVKPVFIQWTQGDELPATVVTPALDDSGFSPQGDPPNPVIWLPQSEDFVSPKLLEEEAFSPVIAKAEISLPAAWPDETISRILIEENEWTPVWAVPQVSVTPNWDDETLPISAAPSLVDDTTDSVVFQKIEIPLPTPVWDDPQIVRILVEENEWVNPFVVPQIVVTPTFGHQDEYPTAAAPSFPPSEENWNFQNLSKDSVDGIIWVTDDDISPAFILEEGEFWTPQWRPFDPVRILFQSQDEGSLSTPATPEGAGGLIYDEISIFRWYQEDPLPILAATLGIDEEPWNPPTLSLEGPKWVDSPNEEIVPQPASTIREDDYWLGSPTFLPRGIWEIQDSQDEVLPSIRDEESFLGASYPLGPVVQVSDYSDDIVPQPPSSISVEETYWLQPDPPRDVIVGWQFPLDINEDFPELSTPPTPPRVEILGGDPVKKRKKSPREEIRDLLNAPSGEKIVLVPPSEGASLPEELRPVAKVVPAEYLPPIGVLPVSEPPPPAFSDEEMAEILALIHLGIL